MTAGSLNEAAILGVQILRKDQWFQEGIGATKIEIAVREPATIYTVMCVVEKHRDIPIPS